MDVVSIMFLTQAPASRNGSSANINKIVVYENPVAPGLIKVEEEQNR